MVLYLSERSHKATFLRFAHFTTVVVLCLTILTNTFSSSLFVKAEECAITNDTKYFNLNELKKTKGDDWIVNGYGTSWTFNINICSKVSSMPDKDIGVYGKNSQTQKGQSLGKPNDTLIVRGDKLIMEFRDREQNCGNTDFTTSSVISFLCDKTVEGLGQPVFVSTFYDCAFFFEWKTPAACPTAAKGAGMGGWNVFFTIFIIALIVYFVGGIVYNRMVHHASGMYQIPNWEFWCNAWDYLKDIFVIILAQCPVFNFKPRRSGGRNYRNLPRDEENVLMEEEFEEH